MPSLFKDNIFVLSWSDLIIVKSILPHLKSRYTDFSYTISSISYLLSNTGQRSVLEVIKAYLALNCWFFIKQHNTYKVYSTVMFNF